MHIVHSLLLAHLCTHIYISLFLYICNIYIYIQRATEISFALQRCSEHMHERYSLPDTSGKNALDVRLKREREGDLCMYIYMYIYKHLYIYIYAYMHACIYIKYINIYTHMYLYIHVYILCKYMHIPACVHILVSSSETNGHTLT